MRAALEGTIVELQHRIETLQDERAGWADQTQRLIDGTQHQRKQLKQLGRRALRAERLISMLAAVMAKSSCRLGAHTLYRNLLAVIDNDEHGPELLAFIEALPEDPQA